MYDIFKNKLYIENIITIINVSEINMVYKKRFKYPKSINSQRISLKFKNAI